jgi:hypothetical protein
MLKHYGLEIKGPQGSGLRRNRELMLREEGRTL